MNNPKIALYSPVAQSGKSTTARFLQSIIGGERLSFADPMREAIIPIAAPFLPGGEAEVREWLKDDRKDYAIIPRLGRTLRYLLQTVGTDYGRNLIHPDLWTMIARERTRRISEREPAIIDDLRFENEYAMLRDEDAILVRINRPDAPISGNRGHVSEHRLDELPFDHVINNTGSKSELARKVAEFATDFGLTII